MKIVRVSNLKALAKSYFCGGFVKLANDGACVELVLVDPEKHVNYI
jgi:hypothetical protein